MMTVIFHSMDCQSLSQSLLNTFHLFFLCITFKPYRNACFSQSSLHLDEVERNFCFLSQSLGMSSSKKSYIFTGISGVNLCQKLETPFILFFWWTNEKFSSTFFCHVINILGRSPWQPKQELQTIIVLSQLTMGKSNQTLHLEFWYGKPRLILHKLWIVPLL